MDSKQRAMAITGTFEGAGWGGVSNAGDGMGWSFGVIQWNFGQSTLQPLILDMQANGPQTFVTACTQPVAAYGGKPINLAPELLAAVRLPGRGGVQWCEQHQDANGQPLPHWRAVFEALGNVQGFRTVQLKHAKPYMDRAEVYMSQFGFATDRALCLLFDVCVQMGSISDESRARYAIESASATSEQQKLVALARAVGPQAGQWSSDVESRKLAIATGKGIVHGRVFDGAAFGLNDGPVT